MFIENYFSEPGGRICFTREQGSNFAKLVADDFNPLHDKDASRFCIPGDLLFSVMLARYGVSEHMAFVFSGMVGEGVELVLPEPAEELHINDQAGKEYLRVTRRGESTRDVQLIENLSRSYVEFSGHSFPDVLQPLMAEHKVMLNPTRPMVMYESMGIDLHRLDITAPTVKFDHGEMEVSGKRGSVYLVFNLLEDGEVVGTGRKHILLSGLREYDEDTVATVIETYNKRKAALR